MATTNTPHQLSLLADHLKLSLLERQRALALNLDPTHQNTTISTTLTTFHRSLEALESQPTPDPTLPSLRTQYEALYAQFHGTAPPQPTAPNNPSLTPDFRAAQSRPTPNSKNVRFRDDPSTEEDAEETANRTALFTSTGYRDDPDASADATELSNQQIHAHHSRVLRDQDEQLDQLGASIGRQRMLGIGIGDELDEQNELLGDVEAGVDRHTGTLERARKRLGHVARKGKGNWSWVTIGILVVILVLLIAVLK